MLERRCLELLEGPVIMKLMKVIHRRRRRVQGEGKMVSERCAPGTQRTEEQSSNENRIEIGACYSRSKEKKVFLREKGQLCQMLLHWVE